jgi:hypothetical protein
MTWLIPETYTPNSGISTSEKAAMVSNIGRFM